MKSAKPQIVKQHLALDSYLQTLLEAVPEVDQLDLQQEPALQPIEQQPIIEVAAKVEPRRVVSVVEKSVVKIEVAPFTPVVPEPNPAKLQALSVMPDWAQSEFQALFFKLQHLTLATPLTELSRTIKMTSAPRTVPGQPDWFLGLLDDNGSRIGVLDTGQLIFGKKRGKQRDLQQQPFKHILITVDKRWGLAFDEVITIGRLQPDKVRWRTSRQQQPWLIGTVIEELTAIVDIRQLVPHRHYDH